MKALVLLSGGIDSSTVLAIAVSMYKADNVIALNLVYGQKHNKERECARLQTKHWGVQLIEEDLSSVFKFDKSSALLEGSTTEMPKESYAKQLEDMGGSGVVKTYVPYRNGLFLSYAAAVAIQLKCSKIYYGAHADDAVGGAYPDCTETFVNSIRVAIWEGSGWEVALEAPLIQMNKSEVIEMGMQYKVPFEHTWSCYVGKDKPCGTCGTCIDRIAAFRSNGAEDPLSY
jgi:7-cyano-7-deazaguanine synthase